MSSTLQNLQKIERMDELEASKELVTFVNEMEDELVHQSQLSDQQLECILHILSTPALARLDAMADLSVFLATEWKLFPEDVKTRIIATVDSSHRLYCTQLAAFSMCDLLCRAVGVDYARCLFKTWMGLAGGSQNIAEIGLRLSAKMRRNDEM